MYIILNVSDSDKHWQSVVAEYTKRLGKGVKIIDLKPSRKGEAAQMIVDDTANIIAHLSKFSQYQKILLSKTGKQSDTLALHKARIHKDIVFIIGGPYGLDEAALAPHIDHQISFGAITLPHGLAKVTLLEQLYRIGTIEAGKSYHY